MSSYERFEPETETHRTEKALGLLVPEAHLPLLRGSVEVVVESGLSATPAGQHLLLMLVHLLARMKGVVSELSVVGIEDVLRLDGVPLSPGRLSEGIEELVSGMSGSRSSWRAGLVFDTPRDADVRVSVGVPSAPSVDICLGADGWRALGGVYAAESRWQDWSPIGPYFAATIGAAEVFKRLLRLNFHWSEGELLQDFAFSLWDYRSNETVATPDVHDVDLSEFAFAGAGAGGTAALYTLASFRRLAGKPTVVEPGLLKASNLGRYLMTDYAQVHGRVPKLDSVGHFMRRFAPAVEPRLVSAMWHEVPGPWRNVVCAVDTPEGRWDVQKSTRGTIIESGVLGLMYTVLRLVPGGWCLECKNPRDPDLTWKRRAARWGLSVFEVRAKHERRDVVVEQDILRLADVQARPPGDLRDLLGVPFDSVPELTECGETPLSLRVPSQAPVLPLVTTAAGVVLAAEVVKEVCQLGEPLRNWFGHDLRSCPRGDRHVFRPARPDCPSCASRGES